MVGGEAVLEGVEPLPVAEDGEVGGGDVGAALLHAAADLALLLGGGEPDAPGHALLDGGVAAGAAEDERDGRQQPGGVQHLQHLCAPGGAGAGAPAAGGAAAVAGATRAVSALAVTEEAVGLVVLGLVTTAELFAIVVAAARHGVEEVAVAAVVGSAAYNATASLGAAAAAAPLEVDGLLAPAVVAAALPLALVVLGRSGRLGRGAGALLTLAYAVFVVAVLTGL